MLDEINKSLELYQHSWQAVIEGRSNKSFFTALKPTAIGWKVSDRTEYDRLIAELHDQADHIIQTWMNGRWVAKLHLKNTQLLNGVEILKIMERRPGSTDAGGLDHIDFYTSLESASCKEILAAEPSLKWTHENNDVITNYDWLSVWFNGKEAKIKSNTVLDIIQAELAELNASILA